MPIDPRRRLFAAAAAAMSLVSTRRAWAAGVPLASTPAMTEGPFYPERWPAAPRASLLASEGAIGTPLALAGTVRDAAGQPVADARIELWQCDGAGRYRHSRDAGGNAPDPAFLGFGWVVSDADGRWAFQTIRPVPYPGRTPHIHLSVLAGNRRRLVTQIFVEGEPGNASDGLWRWLPEPARRRVTIALVPADTASTATPPPGGSSATARAALSGTFEVVLPS